MQDAGDGEGMGTSFFLNSTSEFRVSVLLLILPLLPLLGEDAAFLSAPVGLSKLRARVASLGFPAWVAPLKIRGQEMPALTEEGEPDVSDLKLSYVQDKEKEIPSELTFDLTPDEFVSAARFLRTLEQGKGKASDDKDEDVQPGPSAFLKIRASGVKAWKLEDVQFSRPLGGKKKNIKEWQVAFTALTAEYLSLLKSEPAGQPLSVASISNCLLGGEFRQMEVDTRKETVELGEKERVVKVGMKLKDPKRKRVSLGLPRPESGELPTVLMATVGRNQFRYQIVSSSEVGEKESQEASTGWVFRTEEGTVYPELILPCQFDGQGALGIFLRVMDHTKEPFHPRTREAKIEVILAEVEWKIDGR